MNDHPVNSISFRPIGSFHSTRQNRQEAPRQGVLDPESTGIVRIRDDERLVRGLKGLEGFERIWLLFVFHLNDSWQALVNVPRKGVPRQGVFATRSPYRPNSIGMSAVRLLGINGRDIRVSEVDLLDGTPVLDIKPYIPYADAFPDVQSGWAQSADEAEYEIGLGLAAAEQIPWLAARGPDLLPIIRAQLMHDPVNRKRKRITAQEEGLFTLAYRTWRIDYRVDDDTHEITVLAIRSGYSPEELASTEDRYNDKALHRHFVASW